MITIDKKTKLTKKPFFFPSHYGVGMREKMAESVIDFVYFKETGCFFQADIIGTCSSFVFTLFLSCFDLLHISGTKPFLFRLASVKTEEIRNKDAILTSVQILYTHRTVLSLWRQRRVKVVCYNRGAQNLRITVLRKENLDKVFDRRKLDTFNNDQSRRYNFIQRKS